MTKLGRLSTEQMKHVVNDTPSSAGAAVLTKQDEIIAKLNLILEAIEAATDAATLFTALDVAEIKTQLAVVELHN